MSNVIFKKVEFAAGALRCGEYITLRKIGDSNQKEDYMFSEDCDRGPVVRGLVQYKTGELLY